jgi:hypothetical protein
MKRSEKFNVNFIDPLDLYKSLKKYDIPITCNHLLEITSNEKLREDIINLENKKGIKEIAYSGFIYLPIDIKVIFSEIRRDIFKGHYPHKNYCHLSGSDGYADIRIFNATYAYMWCGDWDRYLEGGFYNGKMDLQKMGNPLGNYYTFPDITYENPLFAPVGSPYTICTDGTLLEYKSIFIDFEYRNSILRRSDNHVISHFPSLNGLLFAGHCFQYSFSCTYDELTDIPISKNDIPISNENNRNFLAIKLN